MLLIFVVGFLLFPYVALAGTNIDTDLPTGALITENNILPGDTFSRTVTITKLSGGGQGETLMIRFDASEMDSQPYDLSQKMLVSIKRVYDGNLMTLPNGTTQQPLEELYDIYADPSDPNNNNGAFVFDTIYGVANSTFKYQILFAFDPTAGNDFQLKSTTFDVAIGIYSSNTQAQEDDDDDDGDGHNRHHRRAVTTSVAPTLLSTGVQGTTGGTDTTEEQQAVKGEEKISGGEISGEENAQCRYWPLWVWILSIVVFALNFWRNARKNYKEEKYKWIFPLIWSIAAVLFWYYFDKCREYRWFLYGSIIIAIASHFIYLWVLKKKIKNRTLPVSSSPE